MIQNYIKLTLRNLSRQKAFSFINITGLAVGLASSLIILLWVQDELSFDRFHSKADRTYRITAEASELNMAISPAPMAPALQETFPEIEFNTRLYRAEFMLQADENRKFEEKQIFFAEPSF